MLSQEFGLGEAGDQGSNLTAWQPKAQIAQVNVV